MTDSFEQTDRNTLRRRRERGRYDKEAVYGIFDAVFFAHIGYSVDDQVFVTPTSFWREGDTLYWHGSRAGRGIIEQSKGIDVCLTVSQLDGLVLGRTGFSHSVNYRSAMAFGRTQLIDDIEGKAKAMNAFIDRVYPGRSATLRPYHKTELAQISVIAMPIENAVAKIREAGVNEKEEDFGFPAWAGVISLRTQAHAVAPDLRGRNDQPAPNVVGDYLGAGSFASALLANTRAGEKS